MIERTDFEKKQIVFMFSTLGDKISFHNDNILITGKDGKTKYQITCYRVFALFVIGDTTITTGIIRRAHKFCFTIYLFTQSFKLYSIIGNRMEGNTLLHRKQYSYQSQDLARFLVYNKILNQRQTINMLRNKTPACKEAVKYLDKSLELLNEVDELGLHELLGCEGNASRVYFKQIFNNIDWKNRKPRIKSDWINSALDIGYTILFNMVDALLQVYGFDVYCGVYHTEFYMRKSLVCDLMEPLRPLIDYRLRKAINLQEISADDFMVYNKKYQLNYNKNAKYIEIFMAPIMENKNEIFIYIQSYYRSFMKNKDISQYRMYEVMPNDNFKLRYSKRQETDKIL